MKISVTQAHIDKGVRTCCRRCPLALAFADLGFNVMVSVGVVQFYDGTSSPSRRVSPDFLGELLLPDVARRFLCLFDDKEPVEPFTFEMPELTSDLRSCFPNSDFQPVPVA